MPNISISDYIAGISKLVLSNKDMQAISLQATIALEASMKRRIFTLGLASNDAPIGQYRYYKAEYKREVFVRKSAFKPKKGSDTMLFLDGWQGLRRVQGRQTGYVDLNYSGALQGSIRTFPSISDRAHIIGISSIDGMKKRRNMEGLYGKVFTPSPNDLQIFEQALIAAYNARINQKTAK